MQVLSERGFIHQCSDAEALDRLARGGMATAYIGFDCTAPSYHVGNLVQIMVLHWLQKTGHRPIVLMGGGTTRVGDPSGKDELRKLLTYDKIEANKAGIRKVFDQFMRFGDGADRRADARQRRVAAAAQLRRLPARGRAAHLRQPDAPARVGQASPRARAPPVVPRIQLHGAAGLRLRRACPPHRLPAAARRQRPVGQHRRRRRPRPPPGRRRIVRADDAADHDGDRGQDGQDRRRRRLARCRAPQPLRILAVLAQYP